MAESRSPGERIARLRETHRMTREALAERSGVPVGLLASIEDGAYVPDLAPLVKIARALGVRLAVDVEAGLGVGDALIERARRAVDGDPRRRLQYGRDPCPCRFGGLFR